LLTLLRKRRRLWVVGKLITAGGEVGETLMWYCVHALLYFTYEDGNQQEYLVWENLYLIEADSPDEAKERGERFGRANESSPEAGLTLNGRPARRRFASIRKVVECVDLDTESGMPTNGTEVSYSEFVVSSVEFTKLIDAETAEVTYLGATPEEDMGDEG
jgi:hypothetical protein